MKPDANAPGIAAREAPLAKLNDRNVRIGSTALFVFASIIRSYGKIPRIET